MTGKPPNDPPTPGPLGPDETDWDALARYFAGESSEAEAGAVRDWLEAHPAEAARFDAIETGITSVAARLHANIDVEAALRRTNARLETQPSVVRGGLSPEARPGLGRAAPRRTWSWRAPLLAAAGVGAIAIGTLVWRGRGGPVTPGPAVVAAQELTTGVGQRDSLRLADGSRVLLGPLSRLRVLPGYGGSARAVELRGNGLFEVRHDEAQPFVVRAGAAVIRDVGTTFTVDATDSSDVRVVVTEGSVQLSNATDSAGVLLRAGDVGHARLSQAPSATTRVATEDDVAWTRGQLVFRNATLPAVRNELRRWYGLELVLADSSLLERTVNATFVRESPEQALRIIELVLGARVEMHGDTAVLHPARSAPRR
jgi:transmembrane sensor